MTVTRAPGAHECPDAPAVIEALRPLGIVRAAGDPLKISIEMRRVEDGFAALISVSGEQAGLRDLRSPGTDCEALAADLTASLALLLDQRGARTDQTSPAEQNESAPPAEEPAPPPVVVDPRVRGPAKPPPPPPRAELDSPLTLRAHAGAGAALLLVGAPAPAFVASFWAETTWLSGGATVFSTTDRASSLGTGSVDVRLTGGLLRGCVLRVGARGRFGGELCAAGAVAVLRGDASGYARTADAAYRPWYGLGAGMTLGGPLAGRLGWFFDATALVPLHRESFSVRPLGKAFETPYAGILGTVGASMSID